MPLGDAVFNVAHAALLTLGLARGDWDVLAQGLQDRLHEAHRAHLFPRSYALAQSARELGALGATISGAGPAVLVWCFYEQTGAVAEALAPAHRRLGHPPAGLLRAAGRLRRRALSELLDARARVAEPGEALEDLTRERDVVGAEVRAVIEDRARPLG